MHTCSLSFLRTRGETVVGLDSGSRVAVAVLVLLRAPGSLWAICSTRLRRTETTRAASSDSRKTTKKMVGEKRSGMTDIRLPASRWAFI